MSDRESSGSPENILFDQYSRYRASAEALRAMSGSGASVLDVGSGPECLLSRFLSDYRLTFLDPLLGPDNAHKLVGDLFSVAIADQSFDYVISIDTLEHVSPDKRAEFLERVSRIASSGLVLAFPSVESGAALSIDNAMNAVYKSVYGKDYPWLDEHFRYGLPKLNEVLDQLHHSGWRTAVLSNGHAPWLRDLLSFTLCGLDANLHSEVYAISERFNKQLFEYDHFTPAYRHIVLARKDKTPELPAKLPDDLINRQTADEHWQAIRVAMDTSLFASLARLNIEKQQLRENAEAVAQDVERRAKEEIDKAETEKNLIQSQLDRILASRSWRITKPFRTAVRWMQRPKLPSPYRVLRALYQRLPLSPKVRAQCARFYAGGPAFLAQRRSREKPPELPHFEGTDYFIWGVIDWHFRFQRPQHLASGLASKGYRVFVISPQIKNSPDSGFAVECLNSNLALFSIQLSGDSFPPIYDAPPSLSRSLVLQESVGKLLAWTRSRRCVSLVQHPFWAELAQCLPNHYLVYDCMDHHDGFGNTGSSILEAEAKLTKAAQLLVVTSRWLQDRYANCNPNLALIRNAADFEHFSLRPTQTYRSPLGNRIIGYFGAIAEWFDTELVKRVSRYFPNHTILLVGRDTCGAKEKLFGCPNVIFVGEVSYEDLPSYVHAFDVCMIPFKISPLTLATNPVKAYECMSAGKPLVSVDLPELREFGSLVYTSETEDQFVDHLCSALAETDSRFHAQRQAFAAEQTWSRRVEALEQAVAAIKEPLFSIVVVTFNNASLTEACLRSVQNSDYANLEVIVVDNASSDETAALLRRFADDDPRITFLCNDRNLGFAAANNQGLRLAKGEFLVMLNNDTEVLPEWIRTFLAHFRRDASIGLLGPVTDNIGNEAKIVLHYSTREEMQKKARDFTLHHAGKRFDLTTLAFFCVAMPRTVYEAVGPLDEAFGLGFFEDDDYCRRVQLAGFKVMCAEDVFVHHHLSASFNKLSKAARQQLFEKNKNLYEAKWGTWSPHEYRS